MKKLFTLLATLTLSAGLWALDNVPYVDADGTTKYANNVTEITDNDDEYLLDGGWYIVMGTDVQTKTITRKDNAAVHLILADGAKLTATGDASQPGISAVNGSNPFTIYGQSAQTGQLIANGGTGAAGIGGGNGRIGNVITINGGTVTATGNGGGAGIGGGNGSPGSNITINGGTVTATGGEGGAGIGGGRNGRGSEITINGGTVTAIGGTGAAGIGGGNEQNVATIVINGGTVTATGGDNGAGIGGGKLGAVTGIWIKGGIVIASAGVGALAAIGSGTTNSPEEVSSDIYILASLSLHADNVESPTTYIAHEDADDLTATLIGKRYATIAPNVRTNHAADRNAYYSTFYFGDMPLQLTSENVTMYTATLAGAFLTLHEIAGDILPAATPVVIEAADAEKVHFAPYQGSVDDVVVPANDLLGVDVNTTVASLSVYTLAAENDILGFYRFTGTTIPAHKAYLQLPDGAAAPHRIAFASQIATGLDAETAAIRAEKFVRDGQLMIRKGARTYNVQGAVIR